MATLSSGHACVDACQGAVPALLPFLIDRHDLASGLTLGAGIGFGGPCAPLFGLVADAHGLVTAVQSLAPVAALAALLALVVRVRAPRI